ncbi:MAG: methyl-accepting chemotaxis protein [Pseudomonadota bacterium]
MFNQLNNLRFRVILLASLGAPALLVWISGYYAWENWRDYRMVRTTIEANAMADRIIEAAGLQALERGVASSLLSASGIAPEAGRQRLTALRAKSDQLWDEAFATARRLETLGLVTEKSVITRQQAGEAYEALRVARKRVDASLAQEERDIRAAEWIPIMTRFITAAARLRMASFGGDAFPPDITYPNLTVKQSVWLASENAGLERATIAALLNTNAPAATEVLQRLAAFRQNVDANLADIRLLKSVSDTPAEVRAAIESLEAHFLGGFEALRKTIYQEARAPAPAEGRLYSLTSAEWIEKSTAAIDTILKVSAAYSHVNNREAEQTAQLRFLQMWGYIALFVAIIVTSVVMVTLLFNKLRHLDILHDSMVELAGGQGDLTFRLQADTSDEIGEISSAFNQFAAKLRDIIAETHEVVGQLGATATKLTEASERVSGSSNVQSEMSVSTAAAVEEITASLGQVADRARETSAEARQAGALAEDGARVVRDVSAQVHVLAGGVAENSRRIEELGERSREIGGIVGVIREIADQTNLLALNAAIEAARAGEQGRGFAVVADEVRKLAERTGAATVDISAKIEAIQRDTDGAVEGMHASGQRLEEIVSLSAAAAESLARISDGTAAARQRVEEIAHATEEESRAGAAIARNVEQVATMAEENKQAVGETAQDARLLTELARRLDKLVGRFRV